MKFNKKAVFVAATVVSLVLSACGGSGLSSSSDSSSAKRVKNAALSDPWATPCASGGACRLGDTGPGGGTVFYSGKTAINSVSEISDGGVYMEFFPYIVHPANQLVSWGCENILIPETTLDWKNGDQLIDSVGKGAANTNAIINKKCSGNTAAGTAADLTLNTKSDWFLPSQGELNQVCWFVRGKVMDNTSLCDPNLPLVITKLGGVEFGYNTFWSSSDARYDRTWTFGFTATTDKNNVKKTDSGSFRKSKDQMAVGLVRSFGSYAGEPPATTTTTIPPTCALGGICKVGDVGPGGGTVFYVGTTKIDEYGSKYPGGKYLEFVDPNKTSQYKCNTHINDTSDALGSGAKNTALYKAACSTSGVPVDVANNATNGGKSDWFIPSLNELLQICRYSRGQATGTDNSCSKSAVTVGNANLSKAQWSSTQYSEQSMWGVSMGDGTTIKRDKNKYNYNYVLVRAFG